MKSVDDIKFDPNATVELPNTIDTEQDTYTETYRKRGKITIV